MITIGNTDPLSNELKLVFCRSYLARYRATWWDRYPLPGTLSSSLTMTGLKILFTSVVDADPDPGL